MLVTNCPKKAGNGPMDAFALPHANVFQLFQHTQPSLHRISRVDPGASQVLEVVFALARLELLVATNRPTRAVPIAALGFPAAHIGDDSRYQPFESGRR